MAQVRVSILDPTGGKKTVVEVPDNVPTVRLVRALVNRMGLPANDPSGRPVSYRLGATRDGEDIELQDDQTLADAGVQNDDMLRLYATMQAGDNRATEPVGFGTTAAGSIDRGMAQVERSSEDGV